MQYKEWDMTDWNRNGKHDITDSYIDYKIYKDMSSGNTSMGTFMDSVK